MTDTSADCSREAFESVDTTRLRRLVLQEYHLYPTGTTADEIADRLRAMGLPVDAFSIRPRVSELKKEGFLIITGERRKNRKGNSCAVLIHRDLHAIGKGCVYFYTTSGSALPSPYYSSLEAIRASDGYNQINGQCQVWTGSHDAPVPLGGAL